MTVPKAQLALYVACALQTLGMFYRPLGLSETWGMSFQLGAVVCVIAYLLLRRQQKARALDTPDRKCTMSWWKKAVLFSIVWIGLSIGAGILHTDVVVAGRITPEQDATISYRYGVACGLGLLAIWGIFLYRARADLKPSPTTTKSTRLVRLVVLIAAAAFGLYSFVGQVRQTRVRAITQGIHAAFENPQKLPPGHERVQDALRRLKAIDTSYAPPEMKQALTDYIAIFQRLIDDMEAGRDLSADTKASDEVTNRINALKRKYN